MHDYFKVKFSISIPFSPCQFPSLGLGTEQGARVGSLPGLLVLGRGNIFHVYLIPSMLRVDTNDAQLNIYIPIIVTQSVVVVLGGGMSLQLIQS